MRVADAAAQQRGVDHQRLDEAVVGTAQDFARRRLLHAAGGELLGVDEGALGEALGEEQRLAEEHAGHRLFEVVFHVHLGEGDIMVDELLHRLRLHGGGHAQQMVEDALDDRVVAVTVDGVDAAVPPSGVKVAGDDVVAALCAEQGVQPLRVALEIVGKEHKKPPEYVLDSISGGSNVIPSRSI